MSTIDIRRESLEEGTLQDINILYDKYRFQEFAEFYYIVKCARAVRALEFSSRPR